MQATLDANALAPTTRHGHVPLRSTTVVSAPRPMRRSVYLGLFCLAFFLACTLARLIPAFQSPDEVAHLLRADMIGNGQLLV